MSEGSTRPVRTGDEDELVPMWSALWPLGTPDEHRDSIVSYINGAPETPMEAGLVVYERANGRLGVTNSPGTIQRTRWAMNTLSLLGI
jgi:hypothetical protein